MDISNAEEQWLIATVTHCSDEFRTKITAGLLAESDRGIVLYSAELVNNRLRELIITSFKGNNDDIRRIGRELLGDRGPLGTFASRIRYVYAVGLLARPIYNRLECLRKLRNDFAHSSEHLSFSSESCAARLAQLGDTTITDAQPPGFGNFLINLGYRKTAETFPSRILFITAVAYIWTYLGLIQERLIAGRETGPIIDSFERIATPKSGDPI